jgi:hypothetical protein
MSANMNDEQQELQIISPHPRRVPVVLERTMDVGRTLPQNTQNNGLKTAVGLEFLQLNMHHCKSAVLNLSQTFDVGCTNIALIQEPYSYKNRIKPDGKHKK